MLLLHQLYTHGLMTQSIIYFSGKNHETWSDRSPSPDSLHVSGWQLWEQPFSPLLSHLCNCSQPDRAPLLLCHIQSTSPMARCAHSFVMKMAPSWTSLSRQDELPSASRFQILTKIKREKGDKWRVLSRFEAKQVGWSVMREDIWLVHWSLMVKCKWQRGKKKKSLVYGLFKRIFRCLFCYLKVSWSGYGCFRRITFLIGYFLF